MGLIALLQILCLFIPPFSHAARGRKAVFVATATNHFDTSLAAGASFSSECLLNFRNPSLTPQKIFFRWRNPGSKVSGINAGDGVTTITLSGATSDRHEFQVSAGSSETLTITFPTVSAPSVGDQTVVCAGEITVEDTEATTGYINVSGSLSSVKSAPFSTTTNGIPQVGRRFNATKDEILINGGRPF